MTKRYQIVAVLALLVTLTGCGVLDRLTGSTPPGPTQTQTTSVNVNVNPAPSPSPAPSGPPRPAGSTSEVIGLVRVGAFGDEVCPAGASPTADGNTIRVGCKQAITCTPKVKDCVASATDTCDAVDHGIVVGIRFGIASGSGIELHPSGVTPFNQDAKGITPVGSSVVRCTVDGVNGESVPGENTYASVQ